MSEALPDHADIQPNQPQANGEVVEAPQGETSALVDAKEEQVAPAIEEQEGKEGSDVSVSLGPSGGAPEAGSEDEVDGLVGDVAGTPTGQQTPDVQLQQIAATLEGITMTDEKDASISKLDGDEESTSQTIPVETDPSATTNDIPTETHTSLLDPVVRAATPSSRTSTPPLGSSVGHLAKKKFSSVNVNSKFLSKAGSPGPVAGATKIASLNGRPAATPVPIQSSSSRLLSTKLTTVPTKSSTSPNPPGTAPSSATSSPWAKPALPPSVDSTPPAAAPSTLHHPAPTRARLLGTTTAPPVAMGSGMGIAASLPRTAWKAVPGDNRRPVSGFPRDFPTANEVAEGKKAAALAAQAQAAHNQAILQGLNVFTHLEPGAHRWDEEDEDDDVMDFGDGTHTHHEEVHHDESLPEPPNNDPVSKSERFAEDFDRSWPRKAPVAERPPVFERRTDESRVLFNASSNRLEPQANKQPQIPQPTRLMSRPSDTNIQQREARPPAGPPRGFDRPLPPHLQGGQGAAENGRMLPPHMSGAPAPTEPRTQSGPAAPSQQSQRQAWGGRERAPSPHLAERREQPPQNAAFEHARSPPQTNAHLPPRRSFSQATAPPPPPAPTSQEPPSPAVDTQAAEMHTAAEKARLRRMAEEAEREAAAERAKRKARELEERLKGLGEVKPVDSVAPALAQPTQPSQPAQAPPPGLVKSTPQITLATRPKAEQPRASPLPPPPALPHTDSAEQTQAAKSTRNTEASWRSRLQPTAPSKATPPPAEPAQSASAPTIPGRSPRPLAEEFFDRPVDSVEHIKVQLPSNHEAPKHNFDDMLARIQAAMAEARTAPIASLPSEPAPGPSTEPSSQSSRSRPLHATTTTATSQEPDPVPASAPAPSPNTFTPEYFDITYPDPPKSPPPAWRTYNIKVAKIQPSRPPIPRHRQRSADAPRALPPSDWLMSFTPALDGINPASLSLADLLLPQPVLRRFQRATEVPPIISISPRQFEPYEKKGKKKASSSQLRETSARPLEIAVPVTPVENLLPSATPSTGLKSQQLRDQRARQEEKWRQPDIPQEALPSEPSTSITTAVEVPVLPAVQQSISEPPRKTRSPVKSAAARAERDGRFTAEAVNIPERGRLPISDKPGVRFMVSSELEGDSLLDEVNKMSLETLGEGEDKGSESEEVAKVSGAETPKTPPSLNGVTRSSSPNSASTPWSKATLSYPTSHSPARSTSQHRDHDAIKSVWDQTAGPTSTSTAIPQPAVSKQIPDTSTPVYPSLNAPSSADPPASQPLPAGMKMAFSHSHSHSQSQFSSPGAVQPIPNIPNSYNLRSPYGAQLQFSPHLSSPDVPAQSQGMMGMTYQTHAPRTASMSNVNVNANGNGYQHLWSNSSFGSSMASPGYGYSAQGKAALSGMPVDKNMAMSYGRGQKADGMVYGAGAGAGAGYQYAHPGAGYGQQQQAYASGYERGMTSPAAVYGYYGAPGSGNGGSANAVRVSGAPGAGAGAGGGAGAGRFAQAQTQVNGNEYYGQDGQTTAVGGVAGGYYGGLTQVQAQAQAQQYQPVPGQGQVYAQGRGMPGAGAGAGAGAGGGGGARKMW